MKVYSLLVVFSFAAIAASAQNDKEKAAYNEKAAQIQKEVWSTPAPEFKATEVPDNLRKESAVILARSYSLSRASSGKLKFGHAIGITTHTTKFSIFHERVKVSDKSALESFSILEYQKKLDKTTSQLFTKFLDIKNTFIGAKIIKPSGKEIVVNTGEEVLTKNEVKDQKGKLAIPDLQIGDILDYYICKEDIADKEEGNSYSDNDNLFFLVDEYPVLYYSIDFQFNKKIKVKTIYANGAVHFSESSNAEGDKLLSLKLTNLPKYHSQLWTSPLRQYPYIEIGSAYDDDTDKIIEKNHFGDKTPMLQFHKYEYEKTFIERIYDYYYMTSGVKDHFKNKKALKAAPVDSIARVLYNKWKFNTFYYYAPSDFENLHDMKYRVALSKKNAMGVCFVLTDLKVDNDVILVAPRNANNLDNVFNYDDFDVIIRVNGDKPYYLSFDDMLTHFNEIPARYQGEKVIILHPKRESDHEYSFKESEGILPVAAADENYINEELNVSLDAQDMKKMKISRLVKEAGTLRHDDQKTLLLTDEMDAAMVDAAEGAKLEKRFDNYAAGKKKIIQRALEMMEKEHELRNKYFESEIKEKYNEEPKKVADCKVNSTGVDDSKPVFAYSATFEMDNFVKKAGDNYIIDAGKLTGGFLKLDEKDKTRDKDAYMPSARSFKYNILINIPQGYAAKGMEDLTTNMSNKTGSFSSSATVSGDKLTIAISRVYNNNFEKVADWPKLVELVTAASDFDSKKILLEKQN